MSRPVGWLALPLEAPPTGTEWLGPLEREVLDGLRVRKRRRDWLAGRWVAKRAVSSVHGDDVESPAEIQIVAADDGAPIVRYTGGASPLISISHSGEWAVCALSRDARELGCDLERVEERAAGFADDYFTSQELAQVAATPEAGRAFVTTLAWSAKESALKAARTGLRRDTRSVELVSWSESSTPANHAWHPLHVRDRERDLLLAGWWRRWHEYVLTVVAAPQPLAPSWLGDA